MVPRTTTAKPAPPGDEELARTLGGTKPLWDELIAWIDAEFRPVTHQWKSSGSTYGWFLRLIRKQRTILYLLPRDRHFLTAFVFGGKATAAIRAGDLPAAVVTALNEAKVYAEGRGIRLATRTAQDLAVMKKLTVIKMTH